MLAPSSLTSPHLFPQEREKSSEPPSTVTTTAVAGHAPSLGVEPATEEQEEEPEAMSALQKQLLAKRTGRVANKTKKVLAMMEEETVIGDPHDKVKLLKYKKAQVRAMRHSMATRLRGNGSLVVHKQLYC